MTAFRVFKEILEILFGVGCIIAGLMMEMEDPWIYVLGAGLACWGAWELHKELRDGSETGDVSKMSSQRAALARRLKEEE